MYGLKEERFESSTLVSSYIVKNYEKLSRFAKATLISMYGECSSGLECDLLNDVYLGVTKREDDGDYAAETELDATKIVFALIKKRAMNWQKYTVDGSGSYFLNEDGREREDVCGEQTDVYAVDVDTVTCTVWDVELADRYIFMQNREDEVRRIVNTLVQMLGEYEKLEDDKSNLAERRKKNILKTLGSLGLEGSSDDFKEAVRAKFAEALGSHYIV